MLSRSLRGTFCRLTYYKQHIHPLPLLRALPTELQLRANIHSSSRNFNSNDNMSEAKQVKILQRQKSPQQQQNYPKRRKGHQVKSKGKSQNKFGDLEDVIDIDVAEILNRAAPERIELVDKAEKAGEEVPKPVTKKKDREVLDFPEIEVTVSELSSTGDGLALAPSLDHVYVVPFTVPGDRVRVKVVRSNFTYSATDLLEVLEGGPLRDEKQINCQYFGRCSGCQLQMMGYADQLAFKRRVIVKAYEKFSGLSEEQVPVIGETHGSPLTYGYRTKLTPHFNKPNRDYESGKVVTVPEVGFNYKGRRAVLDIEDCPLGTDIVRMGLKHERQRVKENIDKFKLGATLLLRESTRRIPLDEAKEKSGGEILEGPSQQSETNKPLFWDESWSKPDAITPDIIRRKIETAQQDKKQEYIEEERCITGQTATSYEYVDDYVFTNKAGQFFQNNNSILTPFTQYIRDNASLPAGAPGRIKYLLDAYSGSGLFTVTLSAAFLSSLGVDISGPGIEAARDNATANNLPAGRAGFAAADAAALFRDIPYPARQTLMVIDPPRKGCDNVFLRQLLEYGPRRVVYVSCNVHTQARDVGVMVRGSVDGEEKEEGKKRTRYTIESIRGFDFFPQTAHVESVAVLNLVE